MARNKQRHLVEGTDYVINYITSTLTVLNDSIRNSPVYLSYRVFPLNFSASIGSSSVYSDLTQQPALLLNKHSESLLSSEPEYEKENTIKVNGTLSRGINVGTNQNMGVNSNLNLQINGKLSERVFIDAVLSDKSIPVQPDGYSQQINEFDQIYIRLYDENHSLQMGDVVISGTDSYFLKFDRKVQGLDVKMKALTLAKSNRLNSQLSAAIAKGSFNRMEFAGMEGVQGPYVLKGANYEMFIIVLAGSERVFLNGVRLERGEHADYVMNYNTAELTFSPRHMINNQSRIIVEYEYSDKNYNRFLFYTNNQLSFEKGKVTIQYFAEGDSKNQPIDMELNSFEKRILELAGDKTSNAVVSNIDSVVFSKNQVLYKMVDSLVNNVMYDSILIYSNHPDSAFYQVGFAMVGQNQGNYNKVFSSANGRLYKWVAPIGGIPQGSYEPVQLLIAPKSTRMAVAKAVINPTPNITIETELAYSQKDENTFSELDALDDNGYAFRTKYLQTIPLNDSKFEVLGLYNFTQKNFSSIQRFRSTEFERDWNLIGEEKNNEQWIQTGLTFVKSTNQTISVLQEFLNRGDHYFGFRTGVISQWKQNNFVLATKINYLNTNGVQFSSGFYRHNLSLVFNQEKWKAGVSHNFENNLLVLKQNDSLLANSRKYSESIVFITLGDSVGRSLDLSYKNRYDYLPLNNVLAGATISNDISFTSRLSKSQVSQLQTALTYRTLTLVTDQLNTHLKNEQNILGRIEHHLKIKKRLLTFYTFYEIGSGLEAKKEYAYLEAAAGQGIYSWVDLNGNDIPELDEFEVSEIPEEANYIKIFTPTNDYVKVYTVKLNEAIKFSPDALWKREAGLKKLASYFSDQFNWRIIQKQTHSDLFSRINPFQVDNSDSLVVSANVALRNTLSFNRNHAKFGADYTFSNQNQKSLMVNGLDESTLQFHECKVRWNITSEVMLSNTSALRTRSFVSNYFSAKNYLIESLDNSTILQWQPSIKFRFALNYGIKQKENRWGNQKILFQEIGPEVKFSSPAKGYVTISTVFVNNNFRGESNSSPAYTMLEGFSPGENYKWSVNATRNLNSFLRLTINYSGRKPAATNTIHTGQFSLVAYF